MRILGIDFGQRRIGVAVSDSLGITAQPLAVIERGGQVSDIKMVAELIQKHAVELVVMGLPLALSGKRGPEAQRAAAFAESLKRETAIPVVWVDERFTTAQGSRALTEAGESHRRQKSRIDQVAAQLILQSYLDSKDAKNSG